MSKGSKRVETVFLKPEINEQGKLFINDYLNRADRDDSKIVMCLRKVTQFADRLVFSEYGGQQQVNAFFDSADTGKVYCVGGLGTTVDLALLSCYVKCEFTLDWQFSPEVSADTVPDKPLFS